MITVNITSGWYYVGQTIYVSANLNQVDNSLFHSMWVFSFWTLNGMTGGYTQPYNFVMPAYNSTLDNYYNIQLFNPNIWTANGMFSLCNCTVYPPTYNNPSSTSTYITVIANTNSTYSTYVVFTGWTGYTLTVYYGIAGAATMQGSPTYISLNNFAVNFSQPVTNWLVFANSSSPYNITLYYSNYDLILNGTDPLSFLSPTAMVNWWNIQIGLGTYLIELLFVASVFVRHRSVGGAAIAMLTLGAGGLFLSPTLYNIAVLVAGVGMAVVWWNAIWGKKPAGGM
jgi:hypothetical protein